MKKFHRELIFLLIFFIICKYTKIQGRLFHLFRPLHPLKSFTLWKCRNYHRFHILILILMGRRRRTGRYNQRESKKENTKWAHIPYVDILENPNVYFSADTTQDISRTT